MNKPALHFVPQRNWINDPNGLCWFNGKYHLFYQHFPYASQWGTMHWGHAVSDDMVNWEHLPIALFPTKHYDQNGVFSGSALIKDEKLYLYYTGVRYLSTDPEDTTTAKDGLFDACQAMIISEDGFNFDNFKAKRQIIPPIADPKLGHIVHTRDPKVWKHEDKYYMVLGTKVQEEGKADFTPRLLFYVSEDAENWEYLNHCQLFGALGNMWECPDLFNIGESTVLVMSPEQMRMEAPTNNTVFGLVEFNPESCDAEIKAENFRYVDYGLDYYAPQSFTDKDGNRVQIGWLRFPHAFSNEDGTGWNGAMTMPRVITLENGHIYTRLHPSLADKFPEGVRENAPYKLSKCLNMGESLSLNGYSLSFDGKAVTATRHGISYKAPFTGGNAQLTVYVDGCIIETYIGDGYAVISHVIGNY